METDHLCIGGGPAGVFAALTAAANGKRCMILEHNKQLGRKLRITGKGRCNLTNNCDRDTLLANIPANGKFLYSALSRCTPQDVMAYFEGLGVPLKTERGNRVFPVSDRAEDIVQAMQKAAPQTAESSGLGQRSSPPADFPTPRPAQTAQAIGWQKRQVTPSCRLCPR